MRIECTNGSPIVDTLDHLPSLPLFISYWSNAILTEQDELGIYHALLLPSRVHHIELVLWPSILRRVVVLMDEHFPILERLSLSFAGENSTPLTLSSKAFLAPNLRHLNLIGIRLPKRLWLLTSTTSLVTLHLSNIQTSSYFRPRLLVARLRSLPQLRELTIGFSTPMPRPSTERELLGDQGAPVTLPSMKTLRFQGVGAYLESLVAQIRAPLLERLWIMLFNQIVFTLPHLSHLINTTETFKPPSVAVGFDYNNVYITTAHHTSRWFDGAPFFLGVMCKQLDWQIYCAAQICNALIPTPSGIEKFTLEGSYDFRIPTAFENGAIDGTTWHELLRLFTGVKELYIDNGLLWELSHALQVDEVGSDPGFLPNLRSIRARRNLFTSFIDARRVVGRPVEYS